MTKQEAEALVLNTYDAGSEHTEGPFMIGEWEVWEVWTEESGEFNMRLPIELPDGTRACYSGIGELLNRYHESETDSWLRSNRRHQRQLEESEAEAKSREAAVEDFLRLERKKLDDAHRAAQETFDKQKRALEDNHRAKELALEDAVRKSNRAREDAEFRSRRAYRNDTIASIAFLLVVGASVYCQLTGKVTSTVNQVLNGVAMGGLALFFGFKVKGGPS